MKTRTGYNDLDLCSAIKGYELLGDSTITCQNSSKNRCYTLTASKKTTIRNGLKSNGVEVGNVSWIGESRTQLKSGARLQYGYSNFVNED